MRSKKPVLTLLAYSLMMTSAYAAPHFYLQMENRSDKEAAISFQKGEGNVYLAPNLGEKTPLPAQGKSGKYQVNIEPLEPQATFKIIFAGKQPCQFTVGYFAPGNPTVQVLGPGCRGGGYQIIDNGYTLLLYVTDIKRSLTDENEKI